MRPAASGCRSWRWILRRERVEGDMIVKILSLVVSASIALLEATLSSGAFAQTIVHEKSQISVPASIGGMALQTSTKPGLTEFAKSYSYENVDDRIEIVIFRASYPNVGIWFPQAIRQAKQLFGSLPLEPIGEPSRFTLKADKFNGMSQVFKIGSPFASTGIAVVGFDNWLVSVHSTSKTLDTSAQRARLVEILTKIGPAKPVLVKYPLVILDECPANQQNEFASETEQPSPAITLEMKVTGGLIASLASSGAFGSDPDGLALKPQNYCRAQSPTGKTIWYQTKAGATIPQWILPISITGITVGGMPGPTTDRRGRDASIGVLVVNDWTRSSVRGFYTAQPNPVSSQVIAMSALALGKPIYASVEYGTNKIDIER